MIRAAYNAGVAAVYSYSQDRPVKAPVGRDNVPEKVQGFWGTPEELRAEWQAGYDRGLVLRRNWFKGYKAGKAGQ